MKTRVITWAVFLTAFLNSAYEVVTDNVGLLTELGIPEKSTKVIMLLCFLWSAFSKSLREKPSDRVFLENNGDPTPGKGF
jgi:hypothetical protein